MWPRWCELLVAMWLTASPFVLGHIDGPLRFRLSDWTCAAFIALFAIASMVRWKRAHLWELPVGGWLAAFGYLADPEPLPALQNDMLTAFVLLMLAVIPSNSHRPPRDWADKSRR